MNKAVNAYFQTKVNTTDQGQLLIMLYDGALRYLAQAREKIEARDFAAKGVLISKVMDIINELSSSLNMEKGGSLATNLNNLYVLCTARLLQANLKLDLAALDSVVHILSGLRSAYAQIIGTPEARRVAEDIQERLQLVAKRAAPVLSAPANSIAAPRSNVTAAYGRQAMRPAPKEPVPPKDDDEPAATQGFSGASPIANKKLGACTR